MGDNGELASPQIDSKPVMNKEPLEIGTKIPCRWKQDGKLHTCEIIERRPGEKEGTWEYYVHYVEFNRRLDEWVSEDALKVEPSEESKKVKSETRVKTRQTKRKAHELAANKVLILMELV